MYALVSKKLSKLVKKYQVIFTEFVCTFSTLPTLQKKKQSWFPSSNLATCRYDILPYCPSQNHPPSFN